MQYGWQFANLNLRTGPVMNRTPGSSDGSESFFEHSNWIPCGKKILNLARTTTPCSVGKLLLLISIETQNCVEI